MVFRSTGLFEKHKSLFCIGSKAQYLRVQRPSSELLRRDKQGLLDPKQTRTPDLVQFHRLRMSIEGNLPNWSKRSKDSEVGFVSLLVRELSVPADQPDPRRNNKMHHDSYELISYVDGPLSAQIKALRQAYMQSGGSDPAIVAQMIDLQAEAQSLEKNQSATAAKKSKRLQQGLSWELLAVEQENQRLEEEILRIQQARGRHHNYAVLEVQAARDSDVFKLVSCGWTRMELFDQYNQVGNMELCLRLVNGRDGDVQTLAKPDPTNTTHYKYPAVVG
ncbi:Coiled-coil domain-containing protein 17 [Nibea albiflora]|uniref:Coiled-coil domain-containing protein 17 n=1 Tax=Nibea albiflora TaxID=240163 RepID=A0ACB7ER07_NIBAL|nr:Coiled-coil domain-containing protein 17 [Nibea albiflora]